MEKSKLLISLAGMIIAIGTVIILFMFDRDINDQNEILVYALLDLAKGINPYTQIYLITNTIPFFTGVHNYYWMFYGYGPLSLLVYLPVLIYPEQFGILQFQPILFIENVIFLYIIFNVLYPKNKYLGAFVWLNPLFFMCCYLGFIITFVFPLFCLLNLDRPIKCGLYLMASILVYQLLALLAIPVIIYQLRITKEYVTLMEKLKAVYPFFWGFGFLTCILVFFLVWDYRALLDGLIFNSTSRFGTNYLQIIFILFVGISSLSIFFVKEKKTSLWLMALIGILSFIIEDLILNINLENKLHHYALLCLPSVIQLILLMVNEYESRRKI